MKLLPAILLILLATTAFARKKEAQWQKEFPNKWEWNGQIYKKCYVPELDAYFFIDNIPDEIKNHLRKGIYWESAIGNLIKKNVRINSIAIDIGAHIGIHTITMSRKVGRNGNVVAFEPQEKMYGELLQNLKVNHCSNVTPLRQAVGDTEQTIQLNVRNILNEGGTAIGEGGDFAQMTRLDSLNLNNVSLIKIDVECYEYHVFQGARETILRNKPIIIFELMSGSDYYDCSPEIKEEFDKVFLLLKSWGYKVNLIFGADYIAVPL